VGALSRRAAAATAAVCLVAGGAGPALATHGQLGLGWSGVLARQEARYPAIAPRAAARVANEPVYLRVAFVAGAVGGWREREVCPLLANDPHGFTRVARSVLFGSRAAHAVARRRRWPIAVMVRSYRAGVAFGCRGS
jgi:hypothetical protein